MTSRTLADHAHPERRDVSRVDWIRLAAWIGMLVFCLAFWGLIVWLVT